VKQPQTWQIGIVLIVGVFSVSTAAILIRLAMVEAGRADLGFSLFLAASRLMISALILLPSWRKIKQVGINTSAYYYAIASGVCLALHFATWISSLAFTSIAASTTLVTTNPIWVALIARFWFKENLSKQTIIGIAIALLGSIVIALGDTQTNNSYTNPLIGDILALSGAWLASGYLVLAAKGQQLGLTVINYITIAYSVAALVLFPLPLFWQTSYFGYSDRVYLYVALMAVLSQLIGHTTFNWALRWISPTFVTLSILFEPVGASFLGWLILQEIPSSSVFGAGIIVLIGVAIAITGDRSKAAKIDNQ
jgi:drug/metabolite transporter (DMT)-like permease